MTQQIINIGAGPNDGTGDQLRIAFDKSNLNFTELYLGVAKGVSIGAAIEYQFNNTTTEPPASGQIRFNQATQASTTKLWASHTTSSGINIKQFLSAATTGAKLILQDENDNTNYIKFDVTGVPVDKTTYWEFAVAVTANGGNLPNAAILAAVTAAAGGGTGTSDPTPPQGRLTLQTAIPVMTTTQSAKTTIFYTPYVGNKVPIYDGTNMVMTAFAELSNVTTASSVNNAGPAAVAASSNYDLFVWSNAGTVRLTRGPAWTNDTTRSAGTALVMVAGTLLNSVSITNGPAASRGTFVGTIRSNASSQIDWIFAGLSAGTTPGVFGVWNTYNRVPVTSQVGDNTAGGWTYGGSYHQIRDAAGNQISIVFGQSIDCVMGSADHFMISGSGTVQGFVGIGINSTTANSAIVNSVAFAIAGAAAANMHCEYSGYPGIGYYTFAMLEQASATGVFASSGYGQTGMTLEWWA